MKPEKELKNCPFCGQKPYISKDDINHFIVCSKCQYIAHKDKKVDKVINTWNTRYR